jgi:hypothetical protein
VKGRDWEVECFYGQLVGTERQQKAGAAGWRALLAGGKHSKIASGESCKRVAHITLQRKNMCADRVIIF